MVVFTVLIAMFFSCEPEEMNPISSQLQEQMEDISIPKRDL